ncbi:MAG: hypothetical protein WA432_03525 [Candidatus Babeliaceae bacterium]
MNKLVKSILTLAGLASCGFIQARQIAWTPDPLRYGPMHYPIEHHDTDRCLDWDIWGGAWGRTADRSYGPCDSTKHCLPWSVLLFNQADFTLGEIFAGGNATAVIEVPDNPFVAVATLTPRYTYDERGAIFGLTVAKQFCSRFHTGLRTRLAVRDLRVAEDNSGIFGNNDIVGPAISEFYVQRNETIKINDPSVPNPINNTVFAARLDFLTALRVTALTSTGAVGNPMVIYSDPNTGGHISIGGQDATGGLTSTPITPVDIPLPGSTNLPPVAVIKRLNGTIPEADRWGDVNNENQVTPFVGGITGVVAADGSNLTADQRGRFASDVVYTPLGGLPVNQATLWVVPTINDSGALAGQKTLGATTIMNLIDLAVEGIETSAEEFISTSSLNFTNGHNKGLAYIDTEWYWGIDFCDRWLWTELLFAVRWPAEHRLHNCKNIIKLPLYNDGHYELRIGNNWGWDPCHWLKFKMNLYYSFVLKRTEMIAAPFVGQTVPNIGPCVPAKVHWGYFEGYFNATFFASDYCGFNLGYDLYVKQRDKFKLCETTAVDLAGYTQSLDASSTSAIAKYTDRISNKVRAEFFMASPCCEIFAGFTHVFAGKNVPRDTDWYLGMQVSF